MHPMRTLRGELTTDSADALAAFERAVHGLLGHRRDTGQHLGAALEADPQLAAAHCLRGFALRFLARRDRLAGAREALFAAERSIEARGGTRRERLLAAALRASCDEDSARAADALGAIVEDDPADAFALKLEHAARFMRGDAAGMRASAERAVPRFAVDAPGRAYALGMLAFARVETRDYALAELAAREAVELEPADAWGAHALAHVFLMRGRPREGRDWLIERASTFAHCNNFAGHVAWHLALFCVELGDHAAALALYDRVVEHPPGDFREVSNASSLLYRLEERGIPVGSRWRELAPRLLEHDHGYAFADAHYALAFMRAGRPDRARALLASLRRHVEREVAADAGVQRDVGVRLVEGIIALEEGRRAEARELLECARDGARAVGGSEAQRDLFRRLVAASDVVLDAAE